MGEYADFQTPAWPEGRCGDAISTHSFPSDGAPCRWCGKTWSQIVTEDTPDQALPSLESRLAEALSAAMWFRKMDGADYCYFCDTRKEAMIRHAPDCLGHALLTECKIDRDLREAASKLRAWSAQ